VAEQLSRKRDGLVAIWAEVAARHHTARSLAALTRDVFQCSGVVDVLSLGEGWMSLITGSDFSRSNLVRTFIGVPLPAAAAARQLASPSV
jgi:hypothetical protein